MDLLINEELTCKICFKIYLNPITLPCQNTICKIHLNLTDQDQHFLCILCNKTHKIPTNGFIENYTAKKCIDTNAHLSLDEQKLKAEIEGLFNELNSLLARFKTENSTFELNLYASDHLADVRKQIKSKKELIKYKLEQSSVKLINEVNKFEEKFSKRVQSIHDSDIFESKRITDLKLKFENEFRSTNSEDKLNNLIGIQAQLNDYVNCLRVKLDELENLKMEILTFRYESLELDDVNKNLESNNNELIIKGHTKPIFCLVLLSDDKCATGSGDRAVKIWNLNTGECMKTLLGHRDAIKCMKLLNNDQLVTGSTDKTIKIWDLERGVCLRTLYSHEDWVFCLKPFKEFYLASGSFDKTIKIWDFELGLCVNTLYGHLDYVYCLQLLKFNSLASGSGDCTIRVWRLDDGKCVTVLKGHSATVTCLKLTLDERLISASFDNTIKLWDLESFACLKTLNEHTSSVLCLKMLSNQKLVSGSEDKTVKVWDLSSFKCLATLSGHKDSVWCLKVSSKNRVVSGSFDNTIRVWDLSTGKCSMSLSGHGSYVSCLKLLTKSRFISASADSTIRIWDLEGAC